MLCNRSAWGLQGHGMGGLTVSSFLCNRSIANWVAQLFSDRKCGEFWMACQWVAQQRHAFCWLTAIGCDNVLSAPSKGAACTCWHQKIALKLNESDWSLELQDNNDMQDKIVAECAQNKTSSGKTWQYLSCMCLVQHEPASIKVDILLFLLSLSSALLLLFLSSLELMLQNYLLLLSLLLVQLLLFITYYQPTRIIIIIIVIVVALLLLLLVLPVSLLLIALLFIIIFVDVTCYLEWHANGGSSPGLLLPGGGNQLHWSHQCTLSLSGEALDLPHQSMLLGVILRLACMLWLRLRIANPERMAQSRSHIGQQNVGSAKCLCCMLQIVMGMNHKRSLSSSDAACTMFGGFQVQSVCACVQKSPARW